VPGLPAVRARSAVVPAVATQTNNELAVQPTAELVSRRGETVIAPRWSNEIATQSRGGELAQPTGSQVVSIQVSQPPAIQSPVPATQVLPPIPMTKACPFCGEQVLIEARKCKHCHETIDVAMRAAEEAQRMANMAVTRQASPPAISVVNNNNLNAIPYQQIVYAAPQPATNGIASGSLVVSLIALVMAFTPLAGLALLLSFVGGGLAIGGFVVGIVKGGTGVIASIGGGFFSFLALGMSMATISAM
jgi:hypothetical protein